MIYIEFELNLIKQYSQIGNNNNIDQNTPLIVSGIPNITQIAMGSYHAIVISNIGQIWSWGYNGVCILINI